MSRMARANGRNRCDVYSGPLSLRNAIPCAWVRAPPSRRNRAYEEDAENLKLEKLFGPDWHDKKLKPVAVMIHELDQKRPGLKELVRAYGDHAMFIAQLIQAARIYHARHGAKGR
jgi:hypothetical protein